MKVLRYFILSCSLLLLAASAVYFTKNLSATEADFDSFQQTAGIGRVGSVETSKKGNTSVFVFKDVSIGVDVSGYQFICNGIITASTDNTKTADILMKYRYDVLNYASASLSSQLDLSPESFESAAMATAMLYKIKRQTPTPAAFAFDALTCFAAQ